ncbi:MAG: endolytic transglycosylase MltG [Candidatus Rokuibacteriota bacterium]|nr:MAG: endolytic transglycosylase MltG [Candidatus Rokubacteria bacterium]
MSGASARLSGPPVSSMRRRLLLILLLVATPAAAAVAGWRMVGPTARLAQGPLVVEIPAHEGVTGITDRLIDADAIRSRWAFLAVTVVRRSARSLRAGEYEIPRGTNVVGMVKLLESGRVLHHTVLLPEGATVIELARTLERERLATAEDVLHVARDREFLQRHGIEADSVEGYLFPDTYQFVRGMRAEEILGPMIQRLRARVTPDMLDRARARGLGLHQLLTLASIVEREAVAPEERRTIAAVFWNRLKRDMPLQADPTVQYAVGKERRTLTRADLQADHPYNTYRRTGLPPGPIASPGLPAIEATLDPAPVAYLYFVAVDERHHHFSTTIDEHAQAVARYRMARGRN